MADQILYFIEIINIKFNMIIKLIRIKNDLLKKLRKFSKFKEILEIFEIF